MDGPRDRKHSQKVKFQSEFEIFVKIMKACHIHLTTKSDQIQVQPLLYLSTIC